VIYAFVLCFVFLFRSVVCVYVWNFVPYIIHAKFFYVHAYVHAYTHMYIYVCVREKQLFDIKLAINMRKKSAQRVEAQQFHRLRKEIMGLKAEREAQVCVCVDICVCVCVDVCVCVCVCLCVEEKSV